MMRTLEPLRSHALALPALAKFAIVMAVIVGIPPLAHRARFPVVVGLLLTGIATARTASISPDRIGRSQSSLPNWGSCSCYFSRASKST